MNGVKCVKKKPKVARLYHTNKFFRIFHRKEYIFLTWAKCVTDVWSSIDRAKYIMTRSSDTADLADKTLETFGTLTSAVKLWRKHTLFHNYNLERVDEVMEAMISIVQDYINAMLSHSDTDLYTEISSIIQKAREDLIDGNPELQTVLSFGLVDDDDEEEIEIDDEMKKRIDEFEEKATMYAKLMAKSMEEKAKLHHMRILIQTQLTSLRNIVSEDLFEMMMGLDVVHDRKTGYILNHKMRKPEYKFVEFDKGKLHYD